MKESVSMYLKLSNGRTKFGEDCRMLVGGEGHGTDLKYYHVDV